MTTSHHENKSAAVTRGREYFALILDQALLACRNDKIIKKQTEASLVFGNTQTSIIQSVQGYYKDVPSDIILEALNKLAKERRIIKTTTIVHGANSTVPDQVIVWWKLVPLHK
jgi:hypothetical protein